MFTLSQFIVFSSFLVAGFFLASLRDDWVKNKIDNQFRLGAEELKQACLEELKRYQGGELNRRTVGLAHLALGSHMLIERLKQDPTARKLSSMDQDTLQGILELWVASRDYFNGDDVSRLIYMLPEPTDTGWTHSTPIDYIESLPNEFRQGDLMVVPHDFVLDVH